MTFSDADAITEIPQRIWKQRGGHTCSRYFADEDQVSGFCYTLKEILRCRRRSTRRRGNPSQRTGSYRVVHVILALGKPTHRNSMRRFEADA
jgi:hypothetical protein